MEQNWDFPLDFFEPKSSEEIIDRALFFATATGMHCTKQLREYVAHCDEFDSGEENHKSSPALISKEEFAEAVKELMTVSIWMVTVERQLKEDLPEWFKEFMAGSFNFADRLYPTPPAKDLLDKYHLIEENEILAQTISMNLCHKLRLGATAPDASLFLGQLLIDSQLSRQEILQFALTQTVDKLDKRIQAGG